MKARLLLFFVFPLLVGVSAVGIYLIEGNPESAFGSLFNSLWWTIVTVGTIGYGDMYPATVPGKSFGLLVLCMGVLVNSVVVAVASSWFFNLRSSREKGLKKVYLNDHIVVCSDSPVFIQSVLNENQRFVEGQKAVIVTPLDRHPLLGSDLEKVPWVQGEGYNLDALEKASAKNAVIAYASYQDDADTVMTVMQLEVLSPKGRIKTMALYHVQDYLSHLQNVGVDYAIKTFDVYVPMMVQACLSQGSPVWLREIILRLTSKSRIKSNIVPDHQAGVMWIDYIKAAKSERGEMPLALVNKEGILIINPFVDEMVEPETRVLAIVPTQPDTLGDDPLDAVDALGVEDIKPQGHIVICSDELPFINRLLWELELAKIIDNIVVVSLLPPLGSYPNRAKVDWVQASSFSDDGLAAARAEEAKMAFIDHQRDSHTLMAVLRLEKITNGEIFTVASYREPEFDERLLAVGCDYCINVDEMVAPILSQNAAYPGIGMLVEQLISHQHDSESLYVEQLNDKWTEQPWLETVIQLKENYHFLPVGLILGHNNKMLVNPKPDHLVKVNDRLVLICLTEFKPQLPYFSELASAVVA